MKPQYQTMPAIAGLYRALIVCTTLLASQQALALATLLGDAENGEFLIDTRCSSCHIGMFGSDGSEMYTRPDHKIKSVEGLMQRVEFCNINTQNGELNSEQMDDITAYLNENFYKFEDQ